MREDDFLKIIKTIINDEYIGDDCAYLKDLGLVVSQDNLVENVHFSMKYFTPYLLGYKSAVVNISDILASGGLPKYLTVGLSVPKPTTNDFIKEFYLGLDKALKEYGDIKVIGGDLTASENIMVSVSALGTVEGRTISSRSHAQSGQVIVTSGSHGSSRGGFELLQKGIMSPKRLIDSHLEPRLDYDKSILIGSKIKTDYAMMDTSDGLADALFKIAQASDKTLVIDFNKVLYDKELEQTFPDKYREFVLYGGEDYKIIATIPVELAKALNLTVIGKVENRRSDAVVVENYGAKPYLINSLDGSFEHFVN